MEVNKNIHETMHFHSRLKPLSSSSFSSTIIYSLLLFLLFHYINGVVLGTTVPKNGTFPAIYMFGDSIVDPGNNNYIITIAKCNFLPYGRDFNGGLPTGRFGNGRVTSDLLAEGFGVKELLPPYLDPNLTLQDLLTGVSFASGGAGYDPLTSKTASALSLVDQLKLFKEYMGKLRAAVGEERTLTIVSKSIFIVCVGSNDIANTYFASPFRREEYNITAYADLMVTSASSFLQELYGLGARRVGVLSAPPLGCVPSQRTVGGGIQRECAESENQAAMLFNSKLSSEMDSLHKRLPQSRLVFVDIYYPLLSLIQNAAQFGFEVENRGCCGTGTIEVSILCTPFDPHTCTDASKFVFWDSFHPTEAAAKILVSQILSKYINQLF